MSAPLVTLLNRVLNKPPAPVPIRYAIYTRQSVEKIMDFSSCESQFCTCRDFATASEFGASSGEKRQELTERGGPACRQAGASAIR